MDTTERTERLPVGAAVVATLLLSVLGLYWLARGDRNPLTHDARPFSSALAVWPEGWANGIFLGCALVTLAAALWLCHDDGRGTPWVAGVAILALLVLLDASSLTAVGYLPATAVGSLLGLGGADLSVLLSPGLLLQATLLGTVVAFGAVIARRVRAGLRAIERMETPAERAGRLVLVTARTRRWTRIAVEAPLVYALTRVLMFFCVPGFDMFRFNEPVLWAGLGLAVSAAAGAWLTCGLVRPWGEVFPRWMVGVRGRRVPIGLAVVPGLLVSVMVATAAKDLFQSFFEGGAGVDALVRWPLVTLPALLWPLWAFALALATVNHGIRRRLARVWRVPSKAGYPVSTEEGAMPVDDDHTAHRTPSERLDEHLDGEVGVGTDGSLHSAHEKVDDDEREGYGVGTDGSLESAAHVEREVRDPE
jgi:ABC-type amino acid transport system permease subunit